MGRDKEVSNAFVRIGAKNTDLKRAFAESELIANATIGRIGRAMQSFGKAFAGRIGLAGPAGLAAGAAAIAGTAVAGMAVSAQATSKQFRLLGLAAGGMGIDLKKQVEIADAFSVRLGKMIGFTIREGREMAILGTQFGFAGQQLKDLLVGGAGLALRVGREPLEGVQALIDAQFKGRKLGDFAVFTQGPTSEDVRRSGEQRGRTSFEAIAKTGKPLGGSFFDRVGASIGGAASAISEFYDELLDKAVQAASGPVAAGLVPDILPPGLSPFAEKLFAEFNPFGKAGQLKLRNAFSSSEDEGIGLADTISGLRREELGVGDNASITERGPANARNEFAPERSPFPDNFVETVQSNTAAMDRNTAELQRQPAQRPP